MSQPSLFGPSVDVLEPKPRSDAPERLRVLVTVKAAPNPSGKYGETVCVAGIRADLDNPGWIRKLMGYSCEIYPYGRTNGVVLRPRRACKGANLATHLAESFDEADLDGVLAVGDGRNDRCMLAMARVGASVCDSHMDAAAYATMRLSEPIGEFLAAFPSMPLVSRARPALVRDCSH